MAKVDWTIVDEVKPSDMNSIGQEINELKENTEGSAEWQKYKLTQDDGHNNVLEVNYDLDSLLQAGVYSVPAPLNAPTLGDWYYVEVFVHSFVFVMQRATLLSTSDVDRVAEVYVRTTTNGSDAWSEWKKMSDFEVVDASLVEKGVVQLSSKTDGTSETLAATEKAVRDALVAANLASLPRTGGALTGPLRISSWGDISASSGGYVLYGHNCYLDAAGVVYRYRNTHANMGARGIVFRLGAGLQGAWMFDMGSIATVAGEAFTPTLKRILNTDDLANAATDATAKANGAQANAKTYSDGLVGALANLQTTAKGNTVAAINELFQSGVDAKNGIVGAINAKNGNASTSDTWATLVGKVSTIATKKPQVVTPTVSFTNATETQFMGAGSRYYEVATFPVGTGFIESFHPKAASNSPGDNNIYMGSGNSFDDTEIRLVLIDKNNTEWIVCINNAANVVDFLSIYIDGGVAFFRNQYSNSPLVTMNMPSNFDRTGAYRLSFRQINKSNGWSSCYLRFISTPIYSF